MFPVVRSLFGEGGEEARPVEAGQFRRAAPLYRSFPANRNSTRITLRPSFNRSFRDTYERKKGIDRSLQSRTQKSPWKLSPFTLLPYKLFPTDNTTLDLWNVEIDGTSHNCSKCFHPSVTRATLIRRFRSRSRRGSRRLDVWTLLVVQLCRPTCLPLIVQRGSELIDERDVGSTRRFVAVSLKKKKKDCYSNKVSVGIFFLFFSFPFFLSGAKWNDGQDERKDAVRAKRGARIPCN